MITAANLLALLATTASTLTHAVPLTPRQSSSQLLVPIEHFIPSLPLQPSTKPFQIKLDVFPPTTANECLSPITSNGTISSDLLTLRPCLPVDVVIQKQVFEYKNVDGNAGTLVHSKTGKCVGFEEISGASAGSTLK
ncbi:hypothetical protein HDV05_001481, partial [Chytridiales sp. JEL 0842]